MITYKDFGIQKETATLSNGVKILHFNKKNSPISITFASKSGSRYDPDGKEGLAHLAEHTIFCGSKEFKDKRELTYFIENIGGAYGAFTTKEYTAFHFSIGSKKLLPTIRTVVDELFNHAKFDENKIESEKKVIFNEIARREDSTAYHLTSGILKMMLKTHQLTKDITGNYTTLSSLKREDLLSHYRDRTPQSLYIFSCGDVPLKAIVKLFEGVLPFQQTDVSLQPVDISKIRGQKGFYTKDLKIPSIELSFPTTTINNYSESVKLRLLASLLGRGRNSILQDKFRNEDNLLYGISTGSYLHQDFGYLSTNFQIQKEKIGYVLDGIKKIFDDIRNGDINDKQVAYTKNRIINSNMLSHQTTDSWIDSHVYSTLMTDNTEHGYISYLNDVKKVKDSDLVEIANKYLVDEKMCVFAVGNLEEKDLENI